MKIKVLTTEDFFKQVAIRESEFRNVGKRLFADIIIYDKRKAKKYFNNDEITRVYVVVNENEMIISEEKK